jgi:hypothetical protein
MSKNKRKFDRHKQRLQCEILYEGQKLLGAVDNLSPRGLFVRMSPSSSPPVGTNVQIVIRDTRAGDITVFAHVARVNRVRREFAAVSAAGIGLELSSAPEAYYALQEALAKER